ICSRGLLFVPSPGSVAGGGPDPFGNEGDMKTMRKSRLSVEQLQDRLCPSLTVSLASGYLTVSGMPTGTLTIQETGTHIFQGLDGHTTVAVYTAANITVNLASRPSDLNVQLNASGLGGNLVLSLGNGDTVGAPSTIHVSGGKIGGSLTILRGNGHETYDL